MAIYDIGIKVFYNKEDDYEKSSDSRVAIEIKNN